MSKSTKKWTKADIKEEELKEMVAQFIREFHACDYASIREGQDGSEREISLPARTHIVYAHIARLLRQKHKLKADQLKSITVHNLVADYKEYVKDAITQYDLTEPYGRDHENPGERVSSAPATAAVEPNRLHNPSELSTLVETMVTADGPACDLHQFATNLEALFGMQSKILLTNIATTSITPAERETLRVQLANTQTCLLLYVEHCHLNIKTEMDLINKTQMHEDSSSRITDSEETDGEVETTGDAIFQVSQHGLQYPDSGPTQVHRNEKSRLLLQSLQLPNFGNTCFLNACIQTLLGLKQVRKFLGVNDTKIQGTPTLLKWLLDVQIQRRRGSQVELAESIICLYISFFAEFSDKFQFSKQHDMAEALAGFMERCTKDAGLLTQFKQIFDFKVVRVATHVDKTTDVPCVHVLPEGEVSHLDATLFLEYKAASVKDALAIQKEGILCDACGVIPSSPTTIHTYFTTVPEILLLQVTRQPDGGGSVIQNYPFSCEVEIELGVRRPDGSKAPAEKFKLRLVIVRLGPEMQTGHYVTYSLEGQGSVESPYYYIRCSDLEVSAVALDQVGAELLTSSYLAVYERQQTSTP